MPRDYRLYLDDILESVDRITEYVSDMDFSMFVSDQKTIDAVVRNLEIIGEAAKNLPDHIHQQYLKLNGEKSPGCEISWRMNILESTRRSSGTSSRTRSLC